MKYIDGIKNNEMSNTWFGITMNQAFIGLSKLTVKPIKHIPVYDELIYAPEDTPINDIEFIDVNGINTPFYIVNKVTLNKGE